MLSNGPRTTHLQLTDAYLDFEIERKLRALVAGKTEDPAPEILKFEHITGPLIMLGIGEIGALIAFLGEHLWVRNGKKIRTAT